jgi:hypothetical protein
MRRHGVRVRVRVRGQADMREGGSRHESQVTIHNIG